MRVCCSAIQTEHRMRGNVNTVLYCMNLLTKSSALRAVEDFHHRDHKLSLRPALVLLQWFHVTIHAKLPIEWPKSRDQ